MGLVVRVQESKRKDFEFLKFEDGNGRWSRNVGYKLMFSRNTLEQPMGLIVRVQESKRKDFGFLKLVDGNGRWSRNVGNK
jgi:Fic family protein